jgi:uncharacterized protein (TIGR03437 family)
MSAYSSLLVEVRGDSGQTLQIGIKDNTQPDDGTETKLTILLTSDWRTYAIPLNKFTNANLSELYVLTEFVWQPNSPTTAWVRNIQYSSAIAPTVQSTVNGASFQTGLVAGGWNSVIGTSFSSATGLWNNSDFEGTTLPVGLNGTSVSIGEADMAVYYTSPTQINTLVFANVPAGANYLTVTNDVGTSLPIPVTVLPVFPAIFTIGPNNMYAAAEHLDGTLVGPVGLFGPGVTTRPAVPGEVIQIYGTGFGPTNPPLSEEQLIQSPLPLADAPNWQAQIGNLNAVIGFAGLTSSGLDQFNITVPTLVQISVSSGSRLSLG